MTALREGLPPLPRKMQGLPIDERGYPVPWFTAWPGGRPDHRAAREDAFGEAVRRRVCWICGQPLGSYLAFVAGPMCAVDRTSAEPPMHLECADFSARACPFLTRPRAKRRTAAFADGAERIELPGVMIERNPGVVVVWVTRGFTLYRARGGNAGLLVALGDRVSWKWYAQGRPATRREVDESIEGGYPLLEACLHTAAERAQLARQRAELATELDRETWPEVES